jgi:murein DD-endopeptidase MepM/ murein hydrolase activator NlpD
MARAAGRIAPVHGTGLRVVVRYIGGSMPKRIVFRIRHALEQRFPEQRVFLKSDTETRFIRLRPTVQAAGLAAAGLTFAWCIVATAMLLTDSLGSGDARRQAERDQALFEARLEQLVSERDARAQEAHDAQERFNRALAEVSQMQTLLLASENRRREVESGLDAVHRTLRRTLRERDLARADASTLRVAAAEAAGASPAAERAAETEALLDTMAEALVETASERDTALGAAVQARTDADEIALDKRLMEERNDLIFGQLEEAVSVSMEPLDRMFRAAGLKPEDVLAQVRAGYSGQGGPVGKLRISSKGDATPSEEERRANVILEGLDRMALYRIAASKVPFANPVRGNFRFTSGFGFRRDPKGRGTRMHSGLDFAGARGTPIHATAEGTVVEAGWHSGYGNSVVIRHGFGISTRYAHLSQIRVREGERVSRGDRIGDMGNTGRSTGTHLHYEVLVGTRPVNPMTYIKAATNVF